MPTFPRRARISLILLSLCSLSGLSAQPAPGGGSIAGESVDRVIVKFRSGSESAIQGALPGYLTQEFSVTAGVDLTYVRDMGIGAKVLALPAPMGVDAARAVTRSLAARADVEYAEPDLRMYPKIAPNDPQYAAQWHLSDPLGGINAPGAWDITTGSPASVIAIIDTGSTAHPDLDAKWLPGYDFINDAQTANDGDARDADPSDAGDWLTKDEHDNIARYSDCPVSNSSWHGTMVAGVAAAATDNGANTAGVDWNARLVPARVLGKCGGRQSDIIDAMLWSAGLPVPGVPANAHPAKVLNLSLGSKASCPTSYQTAIDQINAAGKIVVVAAGNDNSSADDSLGSCAGVINVAATNRVGARASYSNYGPTITLAAPGGQSDLVTTGNTGVTTPGAPTVVSTSGTSFSAPVVSGVVSLMAALRPSLDYAKARQILVASARPFPDTTCTTATCGAGIIDAAAALRATRDQSIGIATFVGFRDTDVGAPNPDLLLRVTNLSAGGATVGAVNISGTDFSVAGNTCGNLGAGSSCNIALRFNPVAPGPRTGELQVSASDGRTYRVSLSGYGYASARIVERDAGAASGPLYIAKGPDDNYWYTQNTANRIARMTPQGQVSQFPVPTASSQPFDITAGADGNLWFTELTAGRIGRITPAGVITEFVLPNTASQPRGIAAGPDGNLWFTELATGRIGRITTAGLVAEFDIPWAGASPRGITRGPDGNLWFTDAGAGAIGRVTPAGVFTRFAIPWASKDVRAITTGPDGNLWFTELSGDRLGRVTPAGAFTEFPLPRTGGGALGIAAGPDGAVWYTANTAGRVGRVSLSGQVTEYRLPSAGSSPAGIITGPNNLMWIVNSGTTVSNIAMLSIAGVSGPLDYSDMWWGGSAENGWGMSVQQHGSVQFNALYVYDAAGKPVWYVMPGGNWNADYTAYSGALYQPTSAPLNAYTPAQFNVGASPGSATISFSGSGAATLQYTINGVTAQKSLQRQAFSGGSAPLSVGDMWWGGSAQNGWGINLTQHQGVVFAVWYTYGPDGKGLWYVLPNGAWTGSTYSGALYSTTGSPWLGAPYNAAQLAITPTGTLSLAFADANNATMTYTLTTGPFAGTSQSKPLVRQPY